VSFFCCPFRDWPLQVLDLGVTRMLASRLVRVYPYMCLERLPKCGTCKAASRVANRHFDFMGRRSQASTVPLGYVQALSLACWNVYQSSPLVNIDFSH